LKGPNNKEEDAYASSSSIFGSDHADSLFISSDQSTELTQFLSIYQLPGV
jgi:hypothetical protein